MVVSTNSPTSQCFRVDDLDDNIILPDVKAVLLLAFERDTGTVHLRHTETVVGLDAQELLDALTLLLRVWLGTDADGVQLRVLAGIDTHLIHDLRQSGRVAWDDVQAGRTEISDEFDLPFGVSRRRRNGQRAEPLRSVLEAQSTGKHAVA